MLPSQHVELAVFLSAHGDWLAQQQRPVPEVQLYRYWIACRARRDGWMLEIKRFSAGAGDASPNQTRAAQSKRRWERQRLVIEQILASEVPTRVWAAVVAACDQHAGVSEGEAVVRSVLAAHQEARCRALHCLLHSPGVPADHAIELNRLRRQAERWSDLLVGHLARQFEVTQFAADPNRSRDFAAEFRDRTAWQKEADEAAWRLLKASLAGGFRGAGGSLSVVDEEQSAKIAMSMLDCFPSHVVQEGGLGRTLWLYHLSNTANETDRLLEELCSLEFGHAVVG
jgi:hypothetical protein